MDSKFEQKWVGVRQVAEVLGVSIVVVGKWCREGKIPAKKMGKMWRISKDWLDKNWNK